MGKSLDDKLKGVLQKEHPLADTSPDAISKALKRLSDLMEKQSYPDKAIGGPIKKKYARGGGIRKTKKGKK